MAIVLKLVNGLPTMVNTADTAFDESIVYASGLTANTDITIPNSNEFINADASDIIITVNKQLQEVTRDFTVQGSSPYTTIRFIYDLPSDSVVRFKRII